MVRDKPEPGKWATSLIGIARIQWSGLVLRDLGTLVVTHEGMRELATTEAGLRAVEGVLPDAPISQN